MVLLFHRPNFFYKTTKRNILQMPPLIDIVLFSFFICSHTHVSLILLAFMFLSLSLQTVYGFDVRSFSIQGCLRFWCLLSSTSMLPVLWCLLSSTSRLPVLSAILQAICPALFCCLTEQLYSFPYSLRPVPAPFFLHYQGQHLSDLYLHL